MSLLPQAGSALSWTGTFVCCPTCKQGQIVQHMLAADCLNGHGLMRAVRRGETVEVVCGNGCDRVKPVEKHVTMTSYDLMCDEHREAYR